MVRVESARCHKCDQRGHVPSECPVWGRFYVTQTYADYAVVDDESDGYAPFRFRDIEPANYAAMLLNGGVSRADVEWMTLPTTCSICQKVVFRGEVDDSERCARCMP